MREKSKLNYRFLRVILFLIFIAVLTTNLFFLSTGSNNPPSPVAAASNEKLEPNITGIAPADFFGVVVRDPWYEWNTDTTNFKDKLNTPFLESMAREIKMLGARWIRLEFHADAKPGAVGGVIDYTKYDAFINDIAPRNGLKVLALIGSDIIRPEKNPDPQTYYPNINSAGDRADGSNPYTRFFANRAREIMNHYGNRITTYEFLNEPNLWYGISASPERLGAFFSYTYSLVKADQPNARVLLGGIFASGNLKDNPVDYLGEIYASRWVQNFYNNEKHYNFNPFPFDGVAWHPYYPKARDSVQSVRDVITKMQSWGDRANKIWVTETSYSGRPNLPGVCGISPDEQNQADYLQEFFSQMIYQNQENVAAVFWFKFEDFWDTSGLQPWGLVQFASNNQNKYETSGKITYYKLAYRLYQAMAGPALPVDRVGPAGTNAGQNFYFSETGHNLTGPFLRYWASNGGLPLFGFPLTEVFDEVNPNDGQSYKVQYFERERFEFHPEAKDPNYQVLMGLLGRNMLSLGCRGFSRAEPLTKDNTNRVYFPQTGHNLSWGFKYFWEHNGGLSVFGYPLSEEVSELNPADGKVYMVQWFERARFEYHPEAAGTRYEVQLGLLGNQYLKQRGWYK